MSAETGVEEIAEIALWATVLGAGHGGDLHVFALETTYKPLDN